MTDELHKPSTERRRTTRLLLEVELGVHSGSNFFTGLTRDISEGGLFVATHVPLPVGTTLTVTFTLPACPAIETDVTVAWVRQAVDGQPGMGVKFNGLTEEQSALIHRFMAKRESMYHDDA